MFVEITPVRPCGTLPEVVAALCALPAGSRATLVAYLSDGDYRFDVALGPDAAVVRLHATLREDRAAGGTWWTSRTLRVRSGPIRDLGYRVSRQVMAEVLVLRRRFARLLYEARAAPVGHPRPAKSTRNGGNMPAS